jgi:hypothetical protein
VEKHFAVNSGSCLRLKWKWAHKRESAVEIRGLSSSAKTLLVCAGKDRPRGEHGLKGGMPQSGKRDLPAANDPVSGKEELPDSSEELRVRSEDLRGYSQALIGEAQDLCRASRMLRRINLFLAATNPAPDARNKQPRAEKLIEI